VVYASYAPVIHQAPIIHSPAVHHHPFVHHPVVNQPIVNQPIVNHPVVNQPIVNYPIEQQSVVQSSVVQSSVVNSVSPAVIHSEVVTTPRAHLVLDVPSDAKVMLLGKLMTKTGTTRSWYVPLSKFDTDYNYSVSVQLGDQSVTREITLASSDKTHLRFGVTDGVLVANDEAAAEVSTPATTANNLRARLVLNVPEDAAVTLKGTAMAGSGTIRVWNVPVSKPNVDYRYEIRVQVGEQTLAHTAIVRSNETTNITVSQQDGKLIAETGTDGGSQFASL
jgi:hypothetical protein